VYKDSVSVNVRRKAIEKVFINVKNIFVRKGI
jgi:hypothetical protein